VQKLLQRLLVTLIKSENNKPIKILVVHDLEKKLGGQMLSEKTK
jgi:hypothetical protein